ncbi:hypothetical protein ACHAWU_004812 [Discostella pseudostelligera]|uniref:DUF7107 domain-containing protein n=1 Tax=Discostella pseudostelligera TaxID=259834 RepID=A0ABD3M668_9STRA
MDYYHARQLMMHTLLTTIAICFFGAPSFVSSSSEYPDTALSGKEADHPLLLAQLHVADDGRAGADDSTLRVGIICSRALDCPSGTTCYQGTCTDVIPAGGACRSAKACTGDGTCRALDLCQSGYVCSNRRCRAKSHRTRTVPYIPAGGVCQHGDVCDSGYTCVNGRCDAARIRPGGVCQYGDVCDSGYTCVGGVCALPSIPAGGVCQYGDVCDSGYTCVNGGVCQYGDVCDSGYTCVGGVCALPSIPAGGICRSGIDTCVTGYICVNSKCYAPQWFASNGQYCVMDCLDTDGPCCGGTAQSWDEVFSSAEQCCGQTMFQGNYDGCLNRSIQCRGDEHKNKLPLVSVEGA